MRRAIVRSAKVGLIITALFGLALVTSLVLTDPDPKTLSTRASRLLARSYDRGTSAPKAGSRPPAQGHVAPFSDILFDDSGYSFACAFTGKLVDPTSLAEIRSSIVGRNRTGIAFLESKLSALRPDDPATPHHVEQLQLMIGCLLMYEGSWAEADARFVKAQAADPGGSPQYRMNMDALRGVAALRRGEIENCVACCNEASCIFPLGPSAIHQRPSGSREAIAHFTRYLRQRPEDLGIRWLVNIAFMTLGEYPRGVPPEFLLPLGRFASASGATAPGPMVNIASRVGLNVRGESMSGTCLVDDFDNDGLLDVFMPTTDTQRGASFLRNRGDGTFEDRSGEAGLADQIASLSGYHADYDNDGHLDVLLLRGGWEDPRRMSLLRNLGDGRFSDVTMAAGLGAPIASQAGGWADYDNDGRLDFYVAGEYNTKAPDPRNYGRLYRNRGDGTFEDVTATAGVANGGFGKGVAWGDYDGDGRADLYVSNLNGANRLYHNDGDGTFTDVAPQLQVTAPESSFACWFWDYDNDGRLDLWVNPNDATLSQVVRDYLGEPTTGERPRLYHNEGPGQPFRDVTAAVGLDRVVLPMGSNFGDLDNDGFLDIYLGTGRPSYSYLMPNVMFRNVAGARFEDVTAATGTGHLQKGHGVSFADWDRDGDLDLFVEAGGAAPGDRAHNVLFQNAGHGNHWLTVKLVGTRSNRSAIGAKIRVDLPGPAGAVISRYRTISTGSSFGGNPLTCLIGLGPADQVLALEVDWPTSRTRQTFRNVPADKSIEITEGRADFRVLDAPPIRVP